ncbi:glutathione ABC transporter substrate-binding protein [Sporosarcina sp. FSL K6-3457]|uniref:glutathione ABC transporter substrate-binding protein n=1 Tax=Sporosarcina sp. FSL K6-3457 TaxID=2978204 RepID=UPI0030FCF973
MKTPKNFRFLLLLTLVMALFLAACAGGSNDTDKDDSSKVDEGANNEGTSEGAAGGDLVIAVLSDAATLDPHTATDVPSAAVLTNILEGLIKKDQDGTIIPSLAKSWEAIDDTTWEFKLQEGIKFHDGEDFNAEVVKKNFDRILDPEVAAPRAFLFEVISNIEVVDEHTVRLITEYPFAPLLSHLNHPVGVMVSPKLIDADYAAMKEGKNPGAIISEGPIGTGFFEFESWTPGSQVELVKNENYWGTPAHLNKVTFKVIPESGTRAAELETGYSHLIEPVQPNEVAGIEGTDNSVDVTVGSSLSYIGFNIEKKPFDDVRVRQAISMLVNQEEILEGIYDGFGIPAVGPLAPGVFGHNETMKPLSYDPEAAKALLKEAGFEDGFKTTIWTNDNPQRMDTAILLQQELKQANIEVDIEVMEWGAYLDKTGNGEHDMFILGLSNPVGDADYFLTQLFHSSNMGVSGNRTYYENPEVDRILDEARQEIDETKRLELYDQVQELLIEEAPMVYIHHQAYLTGVSQKVSGYWINDSGHYKLQDIQLVE